MRRITSLSNSKLSSFDWCPAQWRLRYLDKTDVPKAHALVFGIAFHEGIEKFLIDYYGGASYDVALSNAISALEFSYTVKNPGTDVDTWIPRGKEMLTNVCDLVVDKVDTVVQTEKFYKRWLLDGVSFVGKVDCIAKLKDNSTIIIDWKTAGKNYTRSRVEKDNQLTYYNWLVGGNHPLAFVVANKETCEARWHTTARSPEQVEQALELARRVHREMQERETFRGVHNNKCEWCEFNGTYCGGNIGDF